MAQPGMSRDDPDRIALYVGNHVLGGSGLVSILSDEIREKRGLSYSSYSYFSPMRAQGPFIMGLQTRNDKTQEALAVMKQTLADFVANGPDKKRLEAAKKNIIGGFALKLDSNKKIINHVASIGFYNLPLDYLDTYIDEIKAVTYAQVKDAFQRRVHPDKLLTVIVGGQNEKTAQR
jgi:zinc protease